MGNTSSYSLLPVWQSVCGETARMAVCDSFAQAARARKDGCHVALIRTEETRAWYKILKQMINNGIEGNLDKNADAKEIVQALREKLGYPMAKDGYFTMDIGYGAYSIYRSHIDFMSAAKPTLRDRVRNLIIGERFFDGDCQYIFGTEPTSILRTRIPHSDRVNHDYYLEKNGERIPLTKETTADCRHSAALSPMPGTVIVLFPVNVQCSDSRGIRTPGDNLFS